MQNMTSPTYTITDGHGRIYVAGASDERAWTWLKPYEAETGRDLYGELAEMRVGATLKTHQDWRGLTVTRTT